MQTSSARVLANDLVASGVYKLSFKLPSPFEAVHVGQFFTIRIGDGISPLLRRPFAYSHFDADTGEAQLIYEKRGNATALLSSYQKDDSIDILGPLGNGFNLPAEQKKCVLIAGGVGLGPILFLYHQLVAKDIEPVLIVGARSADRLPLNLFPKATIIYSNDGSAGTKGTVLDGLKRLSENTKLEKAKLYLCGPHLMMQAVYLWTKEFLPQTEVEVSLEQTMGCAVGACMGCVVKIHHPKAYARVCSEGPVFDAAQINWE